MSSGRRKSWIVLNDDDQPLAARGVSPLPTEIPMAPATVKTLQVPTWKGTPTSAMDDAFAHMFDDFDWNEDAHEPTGPSEAQVDESMFLGEYTVQELKRFFDESLAQGLMEKGYVNPVFYMDTSDPFVSRLSVSDSSLLKKPIVDGMIQHDPDDVYLLDVFVRVKILKYYDLYSYQLDSRLADGPCLDYLFPDNPNADKLFTGIMDLPSNMAKASITFLERMIPENDGLNATVLDWMAMQDPHEKFTSDRPQLPGQTYPGLNIANTVVTGIAARAKARGRDVLLNAPDHFHNAYMYGVLGPFLYLDPCYQGFFDALVADYSIYVKKAGLAAVSWAINLGYGYWKKDGSKKMVVWNHCPEQVFSVSARMKEYFSSRDYIRLREEARDLYTGHFTIDWKNGTLPIRAAMGKSKPTIDTNVQANSQPTARQPTRSSTNDSWASLQNPSSALSVSREAVPTVVVRNASATSLISMALSNSPTSPAADKK
jgi:hypothetical protein